ncbi:hypothetical protein [Algoriphagus sp.]|uniref:hypothetical protein n=1 Tax=Algoriphagus sp. TaxID=1872435 RepID=UPI00391DCD3C
MKSAPLNPIKVLAIVGLFLFASCEKEDAMPSAQFNETEETSQEVDLNSVMEDVDEVTLSGFQRSGFANRTLVSMEEDLCEKVNIEWFPNLKKMIIDFGAGCTSPRGVTRKGKMIVTYTGRYWTPGSVITTTFENFYVNDRKIEGIRVVKNEGFNEREKFFSFRITMERGKITWPDRTFRTVESRHVRHIFLPNGDRGIVYKVLGGSKGKNRMGNDYLIEIKSPLIYMERCIRSGIRVPSAGILSLKIPSREEMIIDFGREVCNMEVTITRGGETKTITLPRS